jgi:hypothetical protein
MDSFFAQMQPANQLRRKNNPFFRLLTVTLFRLYALKKAKVEKK